MIANQRWNSRQAIWYPAVLLSLSSLILLGISDPQLAKAQEPSSQLSTPNEVDDLAGFWRLELETPGGPLGIQLIVETSKGSPLAFFSNGPERISVDLRQNSKHEVVLNMPHYDSKIVLAKEPNGSRWHGQWTKRRGKDELASVPCVAFRDGPREYDDPDRFVGRWLVNFADSDDPAVGVFQRHLDSQQVVGTFLTTTGDYRYLFGGVHDGTLQLTCFDGGHAFLFKAKLVEGNLTGDFWSGNWYHDSWTASSDPEASLPDGFAQTVLNRAHSLSELEFPDTNGARISLGDPALRGKVTLIEVFGSWCPNCHDEAAYLKELHARYGPRGLKVVGVAFELTGDFARDAHQVKTYAKRFEVDYPILIAGVSDKAEASKTFPVIDRIRSYPTTLFLDQQGQVRAIYSGFSGPATGNAHLQLKQKFERLIERLLSE